MPRQYFFWKYLNTIIVLYCIIVQKNPIFVQLSPIQCTYSNIFIRFFKFFPANTNIYQNSYRVPGANCAVEIALSGRQCSLLCLFAPFSPRRMLHSWPDNRRKRQLSVLRSHTPFPNGYIVSRWGPLYSILRGFYNMVPFRTSYASFLTSQSSQATIACLMLAYSFSPKVQSIFWGPHNGQCLVMT